VNAKFVSITNGHIPAAAKPNKKCFPVTVDFAALSLSDRYEFAPSAAWADASNMHFPLTHTYTNSKNNAVLYGHETELGHPGQKRVHLSGGAPSGRAAANGGARGGARRKGGPALSGVGGTRRGATRSAAGGSLCDSLPSLSSRWQVAETARAPTCREASW
jgi:hypothetical protein